MMLKAHMDALELSLLQTAKVPANSGHSLHKGTPREAFIRRFLEDHLPPNVSIGSGEIIDATSVPGAQRNQFDIVIYRSNYPKLDFGGGISGFLIESVIATIEVKSTLDSDGIEQSLKAAHASKILKPSITKVFTSGWVPPAILNFVVAYDGPAQMKTVHGWIVQSHQKFDIAMPSWTEATRETTKGTGIDMVAVLGKGVVKLNNTTLNIGIPRNGTHSVVDSNLGSLLIMFLALLEASNNLHGIFLNPIPYISSARFPNVQIV